MYTPDCWVVLKIPAIPEKEIESNYRLFAGWRGGYLDSDNWRLNSGITKVVEHPTFYKFFSESGSIYKCHPKQYGVSGVYLHEMLNKFLNVGAQIMPENTNWTEINWFQT